MNPMSQPEHPDILRAIPPVDGVLGRPAIATLRGEHPGLPWTRIVRDAVAQFRSDPHAPEIAAQGRESVAGYIERAVQGRIRDLHAGGLVPVLNGTGVMLHTNLGRAVWGAAAVDAAQRAMSGYVSLEVDRTTGERSPRATVLHDLLAVATGAEAALAVNNNAAAVYLAVNSFCPPGRVLVSRGELVEIGGSFRLPEILRHASPEVIEVGTTNRTYAADYRAAARAGDVLLKVHKSNYAIEGFSHEATIGELVRVAHDTGAFVVYDLGSGALFDFRSLGLGSDPTVGEIVSQDIDAVTMSADKLLGGAQAGIIVGSARFLAGVRQNPLRRAVRVDKVTVAALQSVLRTYLFGDAQNDVPLISRVMEDVSRLERRARRIVKSLGSDTRDVVVLSEPDDAVVGGGSLATEVVAGVAVVVRLTDPARAVAFARTLRRATPPVFPRVRGCDVRVNLRAIFPGQDKELARVLGSCLDGTLD